VTVDADRLDAYLTDEYLSVVGRAPEMREVESVSGPETAADLAEVESALRDASAMLIADGADDVAILGRIAVLKERRTELRTTPSVVTRTIEPTSRTVAEACERHPRR
jgi:hypothetical protein